MPRALIADDEPHLAQYLKTQLATLWPALEILPLARDGDEAAARIAAEVPDIAFLDIQMPGLSGLEVAQGIEGSTRVVFVTAYDEYALQAFEAAALDYLLKPLKTERLARCVERLRAALAAPAPEPDASLAAALQQLSPPAPAAVPRLRWLRASQGELTHQIDVQQVRYFHADDKYTVVQTGEAEYLIRTPIVELLPQLDPEQFLQVHRSTIVNMAHLAGTRRDAASRLFLRIRDHERELPVSRAYVHLFKSM
jgi:DNA-binding LytR/AlgR family response regulator